MHISEGESSKRAVYDHVGQLTLVMRIRQSESESTEIYVRPVTIWHDQRLQIASITFEGCQRKHVLIQPFIVLPVLVARLVEKTSALETLIEKLTCSNQQLVALVVEQQQDLRKLSENISIPTTTTNTIDSPHISDAKSVTLLAGNSLLRDVSAVGIDTIAVRRKSGATLEDIGDMIEEVRNDDNLDVTKIVIVGGTSEVMENVPANEIKAKMELLVQKAKTVTPSVTVSSVLPCSKGANPQQLAEVNSAIKHVCDDMNVIFVDHESNLTFRNGDVDTSAFHADGIHLSASGVDRVLSNLSLPKQTSRKTVKRQRHASTRRSAIRVDESTRGSTTRAINRDPRPHNESHQHQQRQRYLRRSTDRDVTQEATRDDMQRDDNEWRVVSRRRSTHDRRTSEQCAKCNESNHYTSLPGANTLGRYNVGNVESWAIKRNTTPGTSI